MKRIANRLNGCEPRTARKCVFCGLDAPQLPAPLHHVACCNHCTLINLPGIIAERVPLSDDSHPYEVLYEMRQRFLEAMAMRLWKEREAHGR